MTNGQTTLRITRFTNLRGAHITQTKQWYDCFIVLTCNAALVRKEESSNHNYDTHFHFDQIIIAFTVQRPYVHGRQLPVATGGRMQAEKIRAADDENVIKTIRLKYDARSIQMYRLNTLNSLYLVDYYHLPCFFYRPPSSSKCKHYIEQWSYILDVVYSAW